MSEDREKAILDEIYRSIDAKIEDSIKDAPKPRPPRRPPQRPAKKRRRFPWLGFVFCLAIFAGILFFLLKGRTNEPLPVSTDAPTDPPPTTGTTVVTIAAGGDVNLTDELLDAVRRPDGSYDFSGYFLHAAPLLSGADLAIVNLEANFTANPVDAASHNAPASLASALAGCGVDVVQTANSYSIASGLAGLASTMETIAQAGMKTAGTSATEADFAKTKGVTMVEVQGVKIALVAFTKGVGNLNLPEGSEHCVNLLYKDYASTYTKVDKDGIQAVLDAAQAQSPDITIALLHWGSEYDGVVSDTQEQIRKLMFAGGVDAIIGTHSHLVGELLLAEDGSFTAYSLGDLCGTDADSDARQSIILQLEFTKNNETGETKLTNYSYTPIYLANSEQSPAGIYQILNTENETALYEQNYYTRVSEKTYGLLAQSKADIEALVHPPQED